MRLRFQQHGRQFFFFTFCVEGRRPVLARIAKGRGTRPPEPPNGPFSKGSGSAPCPLHGGGNAEAHTELLPAGESVLAFLKSLHDRNPALTASDRVVMPDHVHFVLIVDFDQDPGFQPLSFAHRFMEEAAAGELVATGVLGGLAAAGGLVATGGLGGQRPPSFAHASAGPLWEPNFWLALSFSSRQLSSIRKYIRHNPARALWKAAHPDKFLRHSGFRHPILDPALRWSACGELTLLGSPFLFPVRLTRRRSVEAQKEEIAQAMERALCGMIPVCGFLSPAEKELQHRLRSESRARWIKMVPHGLPALRSFSGGFARLCRRAIARALFFSARNSIFANFP